MCVKHLRMWPNLHFFSHNCIHKIPIIYHMRLKINCKKTYMHGSKLVSIISN
jgi:hypothetical protein